MGLSSAFLRMKDRVKDQIGNFFYPQEEFPDDYDMPRESSRRTRDVAPVPQTPQVSAPVYNDSQDPFRQGYMPPRTAEAAAEGGFDFFTTTLTISPLKNAPLLNEIGEEEARRFGVPFLPSDFKKKDGYKRSIELSGMFSLYRQNYCGCVFSRRDAGEPEA